MQGAVAHQVDSRPKMAGLVAAMVVPRLADGDEAGASAHVGLASSVLQPASRARPPVLELERYSGAKVIDSEGAVIGEVARVQGDSLEEGSGGQPSRLRKVRLPL